MAFQLSLNQSEVFFLKKEEKNQISNIYDLTSFFALPHRQCGNGKVWYGFGSGGQEGSMTTRLSGCGHAILDFGNCWDRRTYKVEVYLNEKRISRANGSTPSKIVGFDFTDGDILKLKEDGAIIKFNKLTIINCKHCTF